MKQLILLSVLVSTAFSWPWNPLNKEGSASQQSIGRVSTQQENGEVDLCKSVRAQGTGNTAVHFCQQGSGVCYFSALQRCCNPSAYKVNRPTNVNVGAATFDVEFYLSDNPNNSESFMCFLVLEDITLCETSVNCEEPDCAPIEGVCMNNTLNGTTCDLNGCQCQPGYLPANCCACATNFYEISLGQCGEFCANNCLIRSTDPESGKLLGCSVCLPGYQGRGCCECAGDLEKVAGLCQCPAGQLLGSSNQCFPCLPGQELDDQDQCVCPEGQILFNRQCEDPCENNCVENMFSQTLGCSSCKPGYMTQPLCCNCTSDRQRSGSECVCPPNTAVNPTTDICETCPGGKTPIDGVCACPAGTVEVGDNCTEPCEDNCVENMFSQTLGCSNCKPGYMTKPLCCNCTSDRQLSGSECVCPPNTAVNLTTDICETCPGDKKPINGVCACPAGTVEVEKGDKCINCTPPKEVRDGKCQCPVGQEEGPNERCILTPECGKNQDIIIVLDTTGSFTDPRFLRVLHSLQYLVGALESTEDNNVHVGVLLYPYIYADGTSQNSSSSFAVNLTDSCKSAVAHLNGIAFGREFNVSQDTQSYSALEFLQQGGPITDMTTVITLTGGPSTVDNNVPVTSSLHPINKIERAISTIHSQSTGNVRFYAVGLDVAVPAQEQELFDQELLALGDGLRSHTKTAETNILTFIYTTLDVLEEANVLCPNQTTAIKTALATVLASVRPRGRNTLEAYPFCITRNYGNPNPPPCFTSNICSLPANVEKDVVLDRMKSMFREVIEEAIGKLLSERKN